MVPLRRRNHRQRVEVAAHALESFDLLDGLVGLAIGAVSVTAAAADAVESRVTVGDPVISWPEELFKIL